MEAASTYPIDFYSHIYSRYTGSWRALRLVNKQSSVVVLKEHRNEYLLEVAYEKLKQQKILMKKEFLAEKSTWFDYTASIIRVVTNPLYTKSLVNTLKIHAYLDFKLALKTIPEIRPEEKRDMAYGTLSLFIQKKDPELAAATAEKVYNTALKFEILKKIYLYLVGTDICLATAVLEQLRKVKDTIADSHEKRTYHSHYIGLMAHINLIYAVRQAKKIHRDYQSHAYKQIAFVQTNQGKPKLALRHLKKLSDISSIETIFSVGAKLYPKNRECAKTFLKEAETMIREKNLLLPHHTAKKHVKLKACFSAVNAICLAEKYSKQKKFPCLYKKIALVQAKKGHFRRALFCLESIRSDKQPLVDKAISEIADLQKPKIAARTIEHISDPDSKESAQIKLALKLIPIDTPLAIKVTQKIENEKVRTYIQSMITQFDYLLNLEDPELMRAQMMKSSALETATARYKDLASICESLIANQKT